MGIGASRAEPQVHVVVVQSNEDGSIRAEHVQSNQRQGGDRNRRRPALYSNSPQYTRNRRVQQRRETPSSPPLPPSPGSPPTSGQPEFKLFRRRDNNEYTVLVAEDGQMYYVDWEQQELEVLERQEEERQEAMRRAIIEQERQRLLRENAAKLLDYLPKGVLRDEEDISHLGEDFKDAYKSRRVDLFDDEGW